MNNWQYVKRLFSFTLLMIVSTFFIQLAAIGDEMLARGQVSATVSWHLSVEGLLTVDGTGSIPDYEKGANDQPWAEYKSAIRTLSIGDGITRIGARAFQSCRQLRNAEISNTVQSIGIWAFQNCTNLTDLKMHRGVAMEKRAFTNTPIRLGDYLSESKDYLESRYFTNLLQCDLSENLRKNVITVAESQIGYHEGDSESDLAGMNKAGTGNYTEYERLLGTQNASWCSEFACWCIRMAGVPYDIINDSRSANINNYTLNSRTICYLRNETTLGGGNYEPRSGDIILWAEDRATYTDDENLKHSSIFVRKVTEDNQSAFIETIDGNKSDNVSSAIRQVSKNDGSIMNDNYMVLYAILSPDYEADSIEHYTVSFVDERTSTVVTKRVSANSIFGALPKPQKSDGFLGWFTEANGGELINMYSTVRQSEDMILYAHYQ